MASLVSKSFSKAKRYRCKVKSFQKTVKYLKDSKHRQSRRNIKQSIKKGDEIIFDIKPLTSYEII